MPRLTIEKIAALNDASPAEVKDLIAKLRLRSSGYGGGQVLYSGDVAGRVGQALKSMRNWHRQAAEQQPKAEAKI